MMSVALAAEVTRVARAKAHVAVRDYTSADAPRWSALVARCAEATFFHSIGWREIIEEIFRHRTHYLVAQRGSELSGILPLAEVRSRVFGHALVSLPFSVYGGPVAEDEETESALIEAAEERARELGVQHLELRNRRALRPDWPRQDLYVTFRKTLLPDVDANLQAIPRKQRAMVRKGIKHGLRGEIDESVDRFFELYADNVHRHGTPPFAKAYFARLRDVFADNCEILTIVGPQGKPVSGVLSFHFRNEVLPYYAGDTMAARDLAANDFKYWDLMRRSCERGFTTFDFGRSKQGTGSYDFKRNWGFDAEPLAYEYALLGRNSVPQNNPLNPKYRLFIAMWRHLPRRAANALGPHIVRNLG